MTPIPEPAGVSAEEAQALHLRLRHEPDPRFLARLRSDTRARHARLSRKLGWFDLDFELGPLRLVHDGELVHLVTNDVSHFRDRAGDEFRYVPDRAEAPRVRERVRRALAGRLRGSEVSFLADLPVFHRRVLEAAASIPRGEVRPYAWAAREAGASGAVRAAGTALAHNPVPFVVPCHRVLKSDWALGQYSAGGPEVKGRVLSHEGVQLRRLADLSARHLRYLGHAGTTFCVPGCGGAWESVDDDRQFHSVSEALAAGYEPCTDCRPA